MPSHLEYSLQRELQATELQSLEVFSKSDQAVAADKLLASVSALNHRLLEAQRSGQLSQETWQMGYHVLKRVSIVANSLASAEDARDSILRTFERDIRQVNEQRPKEAGGGVPKDFFVPPALEAAIVEGGVKPSLQRPKGLGGERSSHLDDPTPKGNARLRLAEGLGWDVKQVDAWFSAARTRSGWTQLRKTTRRQMFEVLQLGRSMPSLLEPAERSGLKRLQQWLALSEQRSRRPPDVPRFEFRDDPPPYEECCEDGATGRAPAAAPSPRRFAFAAPLVALAVVGFARMLARAA